MSDATAAANAADNPASTSEAAPWLLSGRPHPVVGVPDPQLVDAQRVLGETFEPVDIGPQDDAEPDLVAAVTHLRRLRETLTGIAGAGADLREVAELLGQAAKLVEQQSPGAETMLATQWSEGGPGARRTNPVGGIENVVAPPVIVYAHPDGSVTSRVTLGIAYQGPPGCVHGGISAMILDHLFGNANHWVGRTGMTAHYEIDYRRPTPLLQPLDMKAWVDEVDGRKTWLRATIEHNGQLCVEAKALFITAKVPLPGRESTSVDGQER